MDINSIGEIIKLDSYRKEITFNLNYISLEDLEFLENLFVNKINCKIKIKSCNKKSKTNAQLRLYYMLLGNILKNSKSEVTAKNLKALDEEIKKRVFPCDILEIEDSKIPLIPISKANMDIGQVSMLIEYLYQHYSNLLINS